MAKETGRKLIAQNKKARHDFSIEETYEAGLVLVGTEVKSLRLGRGSLVDGFVMVDRGEAFLHNVHIPEYEQGTWTTTNLRARENCFYMPTKSAKSELLLRARATRLFHFHSISKMAASKLKLV